MIVDLFYFFDELDLLEIRLNMYDELVDLFVIVDANTTFAGKPHRPILANHEKRFKKWWDKMVIIIATDFPENKEIAAAAIMNTNIGSGEHYWIREFYIKEHARVIYERLNDKDIVFISDIDEFWNPELFTELTSVPSGSFIRPEQKAIYYYFNLRCSETNGWTGTVIGRVEDLKSRAINDVRTRAKTSCIEIPNGGWHFGFIVGLDGHNTDTNKMTRRRHPEYDRWINNFGVNVSAVKDYRGRDFKYWVDNDNLPRFLLLNRSRFSSSFLAQSS